MPLPAAALVAPGAQHSGQNYGYRRSCCCPAVLWTASNKVSLKTFTSQPKRLIYEGYNGTGSHARRYERPQSPAPALRMHLAVAPPQLRAWRTCIVSPIPYYLLHQSVCCMQKAELLQLPAGYPPTALALALPRLPCRPPGALWLSGSERSTRVEVASCGANGCSVIGLSSPERMPDMHPQTLQLTRAGICPRHASHALSSLP